MNELNIKLNPICTSIQPCVQICKNDKKCHKIRFLKGNEIDKLINIDSGSFNTYVNYFKKYNKLKKAKTIIAIKNLEDALYDTRNPKKATKKQKKRAVKYYSLKKKVNSNKINQILNTHLGKEQIWIDTYTTSPCAGNNLIMTINNDVICVPHKISNTLYVWTTRAPCIDKNFGKQQQICKEQLSGNRRDYSWKTSIPMAPRCSDFSKTTITSKRLQKKSDIKWKNRFFEL